MNGPIDSNFPIPEGDLNKIDGSQSLSKTDNEVQSASQKRFSNTTDKLSTNDSKSLEKPASRNISKRNTEKADLVNFNTRVKASLKEGDYSRLLENTEAFIKKYKDSNILPDKIYSLELALLCHLDGDKDISSSLQDEITKRLSSYLEDNDVLELLTNSINYIDEKGSTNDQPLIKESLGKMYFKCLEDLNSISKDDRSLALKLILDQPQLASSLTPKNIRHFETKHQKKIYESLKSEIKEVDGWKALFLSSPSMRRDIVKYLQSYKKLNLCARCINNAVQKESSSKSKEELLYYSLALLNSEVELSKDTKRVLCNTKDQLLKADDLHTNIKNCFILLDSNDLPIKDKSSIEDELIGVYVFHFSHNDQVTSDQIEFCSELFMRSTDNQLAIANTYLNKGLEKQLLDNIDSCLPEDLDRAMPAIKFLVDAKKNYDNLDEIIKASFDFEGDSAIEMIQNIDRLRVEGVLDSFSSIMTVVFCRLTTEYLKNQKFLSKDDENYLKAVLRNSPETSQVFKKLPWYGDITGEMSNLFYEAELKVEEERFEELKQCAATDEEWISFFNQATSQREKIFRNLLLENYNDVLCFQCIEKSLQKEDTSQNLFFLYMLSQGEDVPVNARIMKQADELFIKQLSEIKDPLSELRELEKYRSSSGLTITLNSYYDKILSQYIKIIPNINILNEEDLLFIESSINKCTKYSLKIAIAKALLHNGFEKECYDIFHLYESKRQGVNSRLRNLFFTIEGLSSSQSIESMIRNNPRITGVLFELDLIRQLDANAKSIVYYECLKQGMFRKAKDLFKDSKNSQNDFVGESLYLAHEIDPSIQSKEALETLVTTLDAINETQKNDGLDESTKETLTFLIAVLESSTNNEVQDRIKKPIASLKKVYPELNSLKYIDQYSARGLYYIDEYCSNDIEKIFLKHTLLTNLQNGFEKEYIDNESDYIPKIIKLEKLYHLAIEELDYPFKKRATDILENIFLAKLKDSGLKGDESDLLESMIKNNPSIIQTLFNLDLISSLEGNTKSIVCRECLKQEMFSQAIDLFKDAKDAQNDFVAHSLYLAHKIDRTFKSKEAVDYLLLTLDTIIEAQENNSLDESTKEMLTILIAVLESSTDNEVQDRIKKPLTNLKKIYPELESLKYIDQYSAKGLSYISSSCLNDINSVFLKHTLLTKGVFPLKTRKKSKYKKQLKILSNAAIKYDLGEFIETELLKDLSKMPKHIQLHLFFCSVHHENIDLALKIAEITAKNKPDSYAEKFFTPYQEILTAVLVDPGIKTYDDIIQKMAIQEDSEAKNVFFETLAQLKDNVEVFDLPPSLEIKMISLMESNLENLIDKAQVISQKIQLEGTLDDSEKLVLEDIQLIQMLEAKGLVDRYPGSNQYMFMPEKAYSDFPIFEHVIRGHIQNIQALVDTEIFDTLYSKYIDSIVPGSILLYDSHLQNRVFLEDVKTRHDLKQKNIVEKVASVISTVIKDITGDMRNIPIYIGDSNHAAVVCKKGSISQIIDKSRVDRLCLDDFLQSRAMTPNWDQLIQIDYESLDIEIDEIKTKSQSYFEEYIQEFSSMEVSPDGDRGNPTVHFSTLVGIKAFFLDSTCIKFLRKIGVVKKNRWSKNWQESLKKNDVGSDSAYNAISEESMICAQYSALQISYALHKTNESLKKDFNQVDCDFIQNPLTSSYTFDSLTPERLKKKLQPYFKWVGLEETVGELVSNSVFQR